MTVGALVAVWGRPRISARRDGGQDNFVLV